MAQPNISQDAVISREMYVQLRADMNAASPNKRALPRETVRALFNQNHLNEARIIQLIIYFRGQNAEAHADWLMRYGNWAGILDEGNSGIKSEFRLDNERVASRDSKVDALIRMNSVDLVEATKLESAPVLEAVLAELWSRDADRALALALSCISAFDQFEITSLVMIAENTQPILFRKFFGSLPIDQASRLVVALKYTDRAKAEALANMYLAAAPDIAWVTLMVKHFKDK